MYYVLCNIIPYVLSIQLLILFLEHMNNYFYFIIKNIYRNYILNIIYYELRIKFSNVRSIC